MGKKILKSIVVIILTFLTSVLCGIIGFGRQYHSIMPEQIPAGRTIGILLIAIGSVITLATSMFILRYFVFFTGIQVMDSKGKTISDNGSISIGSAKFKPIVIASIAALLGMVFFGIGFGMIFDEMTIYVFYILSIAAIFLCIGIVFFLFSVIHHKIRRRFAWIVSGVCGTIAVILFINAIPAISDINISDDSLTAVIGTVSSATPDNGILSGPGKTEIIIKGTSGESITMRYSGNADDLKIGSRYTFYYLPNTHFINKVVQADNINI